VTNQVDGFPENIIPVDAVTRVALQENPAVSPFDYRKPSEEQLGRIETIRSAFKEVSSVLDFDCPNSRSLSTARTHLEIACMFAVRSVVFEGNPQI
jgi:hypothetical protein